MRYLMLFFIIFHFTSNGIKYIPIALHPGIDYVKCGKALVIDSKRIVEKESETAILYIYIIDNVLVVVKLQSHRSDCSHYTH